MPLRRLLQSDLAATNSRCQRRIVPCVAMALGFSGALTDIDPPLWCPGSETRVADSKPNAEDLAPDLKSSLTPRFTSR